MSGRNENDCDMTKRIWGCHWPLLFIYSTFCMRMSVYMWKCVYSTERKRKRGSRRAIKRERERKKTKNEYFKFPDLEAFAECTQPTVHMHCLLVCVSVCITAKSTVDTLNRHFSCWMFKCVFIHTHKCARVFVLSSEFIWMCLPCEMCNFFPFKCLSNEFHRALQWLKTHILLYNLHNICHLQIAVAECEIFSRITAGKRNGNRFI